MKKIIASVLTVTALSLSSASQAAVITFDELAFPGANGTPEQTFATLVLGDYRFTALQANTPFVVRAQGDANNADPGGATLGIRTSGSFPGFTFSRIDGSAFDLTGLQATHLNNALTDSGNGGTLDIFFDGVVGFQSTYNTTPGFQTYNFSGTGVRTVRITSNNFFQIDNLTVTAGAVPEPASWMLMLAGFAAIGGALRLRGSRTALPRPIV